MFVFLVFLLAPFLVGLVVSHHLLVLQVFFKYFDLLLHYVNHYLHKLNINSLSL